MNEWIQYLEFAANSFALMVAGVLYAFYVKTLKQQSNVAKERIEFLKDKLDAKDLEIARERSKAPDALALALAKRIDQFEAEIIRLSRDKENHLNELEIKNNSLDKLKAELKAVNASKQQLNKSNSRFERERISFDLTAYGLDIETYNYDSFSTVQEILNHIYLTYLTDEHESWMYGREWIIKFKSTGENLESQGTSDQRMLRKVDILPGTQLIIRPLHRNPMHWSQTK